MPQMKCVIASNQLVILYRCSCDPKKIAIKPNIKYNKVMTGFILKTKGKTKYIQNNNNVMSL